jgi:hypothetical protein
VDVLENPAIKQKKESAGEQKTTSCQSDQKCETTKPKIDSWEQLPSEPDSSSDYGKERERERERQGEHSRITSQKSVDLSSDAAINPPLFRQCRLLTIDLVPLTDLSLGTRPQPLSLILDGCRLFHGVTPATRIK